MIPITREDGWRQLISTPTARESSPVSGRAATIRHHRTGDANHSIHCSQFGRTQVFPP